MHTRTTHGQSAVHPSLVELCYISLVRFSRPPPHITYIIVIDLPLSGMKRCCGSWGKSGKSSNAAFPLRQQLISSLGNLKARNIDRSGSWVLVVKLLLQESAVIQNKFFFLISSSANGPGSLSLSLLQNILQER